MDILRVLSAPDLEVRKKVLGLALDLVTSRTIEEVDNYNDSLQPFCQILPETVVYHEYRSHRSEYFGVHCT